MRRPFSLQVVRRPRPNCPGPKKIGPELPIVSSTNSPAASIICGPELGRPWIRRALRFAGLPVTRESFKTTLSLPWSHKIFLGCLEILWKKHATVVSVRGPPDWNNIVRRHREVLNISLDPPETKRILLKS